MLGSGRNPKIAFFSFFLKKNSIRTMKFGGTSGLSALDFLRVQKRLKTLLLGLGITKVKWPEIHVKKSESPCGRLGGVEKMLQFSCFF